MEISKSIKILSLLSSPVIVIFFIIAPGAAEDVPMVTKKMLVGYLNNAEVFILDVRTENDWKASRFKIKGALREDPVTFDPAANKYPENLAIVLYCACPNGKTSTVLVKKLRDEGFTLAYVLKGGWNEWLKARYPVEKK